MIDLLAFQQSVTTTGWAVTHPVVDSDTVAEYAARPLATPLAWHRQVA